MIETCITCVLHISQDHEFSVAQIEYPLGDSSKKGIHIYFLLHVFWVILLFCQIVLSEIGTGGRMPLPEAVLRYKGIWQTC